MNVDPGFDYADFHRYHYGPRNGTLRPNIVRNTSILGAEFKPRTPAETKYFTNIEWIRRNYKAKEDGETWR